MTTLKTPSGMPASRANSAMRIDVPDVNSEGFKTTVQPPPIAHGTRSDAMMKGKFQGVMMPTTPTGSRNTRPKPIVADVVVGLAFQRTRLAGGIGPEIGAERDLARAPG